MHEHASKSPLSPADSQEDQEMEESESESEEVDPHLLHDRNPDDVSGFWDSDEDSADTLMLPGGGPGDDGVRVATNLPAEMPTDPIHDTSSDSDDEDGQGPTFFEGVTKRVYIRGFSKHHSQPDRI